MSDWFRTEWNYDIGGIPEDDPGWEDAAGDFVMFLVWALIVFGPPAWILWLIFR
jgi:hypothetical protein